LPHVEARRLVEPLDGPFRSWAIFTQADDWGTTAPEREKAVAGFYFDQSKRPARIRLHLVRDEVLA
jgi:hypothetical protein